MLGLNDKVPVLQQQWEQGDQLIKTQCSHVLVEGNRCWERAHVTIHKVIHLHARDKGRSTNVDYYIIIWWQIADLNFLFKCKNLAFFRSALMSRDTGAKRLFIWNMSNLSHNDTVFWQSVKTSLQLLPLRFVRPNKCWKSSPNCQFVAAARQISMFSRQQSPKGNRIWLRGPSWQLFTASMAFCRGSFRKLSHKRLLLMTFVCSWNLSAFKCNTVTAKLPLKSRVATNVCSTSPKV